MKKKVRWICDKCVLRLNVMKNYAASDKEYFNLRDLVENLMGLVKNVVNDNVQINKKLEEVTLQVSSVKVKSKQKVENTVPEVEKIYLDNRNIEEITSLERNESLNQKRVLHSTTRSKNNKNIKSTGSDSTNRAIGTERFTEKSSNVDDGGTVASSQTSLNGELVTMVQHEHSVGTNSDDVDVSSDCSDFYGFDEIPNSGIGQAGKWITVIDKKKKSFASVVKEVGTRVNAGGEAIDRVKPNLKKFKRRSNKILVGTGETNLIQGTKMAWFHLGKVKSGTSEEEVRNFIKTSFPSTGFLVEKMECKGVNESFKIGVDFTMKDKVADNSLWPKNITLKRFLFKRRETPPQR
ncbi:hypothetical protein J6590_049966 [Homalodisca vitripennis]|nr:hypothetical protein J6590_049966 [Homalodisca vitripennis]